MFWHVFTNQLKVMLRNRTMIFWTLAFPIILGILFNLAFSNLNNAIQDFEAIDVAAVDDKNYQTNDSTRTAIEQLSKGDRPILRLHKTSANEAIKLLDDKKVDAIIKVEDSKPLVTVRGGGINETIVKNAIDQTMQMNDSMSSAIQSNPSLLANPQMANIGTTNYQKDVTADVDHTVLYFYTLIGMACMYAALFGIFTVNRQEANLTTLGARLTASPVSKGVTLTAGMLAGFVIAYVESIILYVFLTQVLGINFGSEHWPILLTMAVGSLAGIAVGVLIGAAFKKDENFKSGILISFTMLCSFLAGMMGSAQIKHFIDLNIPILAKINPVNNISDALFSLFYFGIGSRFWQSIFYLATFVIIVTIISWLLLRKKRYASI